MRSLDCASLLPMAAWYSLMRNFCLCGKRMAQDRKSGRVFLRDAAKYRPDPRQPVLVGRRIQAMVAQQSTGG